LIKNEGEKPIDIKKHKTRDGKDIYALNIARRSLNLAPVEEEIKTIEEFLEGILMYEHLDKSSQEKERKEWEKKFRSKELELLQESDFYQRQEHL